MPDCVAVITPVYCTEENNRRVLLEQTLASVQAQEYPSIWHIVVNDGSSVPIKDFSSLRHQVVVLHKRNGGQSSAINMGLEYALKNIHPAFLTVLHSDDVLYPSSIANRVACCSSDHPVVYSDVAVFANESSGLLRSRQFSGNELYAHLLKVKNIPYPSLLWSARFFSAYVGRFDEQLRDSEDWDVCLSTAQVLCAQKKSAFYLPIPTVAYRLHEKKLTQKNINDGTKWKCHKRILKKHLDGPRYLLALLRSCRMIAPALLPDILRIPLRELRNIILGAPVEEYADEFLQKLRKNM